MPETMKLVGITKTNLTKNENGENLSHLEITEVIEIDSKNYVDSKNYLLIQRQCNKLFLLEI